MVFSFRQKSVIWLATVALTYFAMDSVMGRDDPYRFPSAVETASAATSAQGYADARDGFAPQPIFSGVADLPTPRLKLIEDRIFQYANARRAQYDLPELKPNARLVSVAREHSEDMAKTGKWGHNDSKGGILEIRLDAIRPCGNVSCSVEAENIYGIDYSDADGARYFLKTDEQADRVASAVIESWMKSPGHRANILRAGVEEMGIGVAVSTRGMLYVTQDFVRRTPNPPQESSGLAVRMDSN
jgi:uncharacterized protein YkwD